MKRIVWLLMVMMLVITACESIQKEDAHQHAGGNDHGSDHGTEGSSGIKAEDVTVLYTFPNGNPQPHQDATLTIQVQERDGKPIKHFDIKHEKLLHLIVVSKDLNYFNHIHPVEKGEGAFEIATEFPSGGPYKLISDFVPTGASAMTKSEWVKVEGEAAAAAAIKPDTYFTKAVEGLEVTLVTEPLKAGEEIMLAFTIKDAESKSPITNLQPYLGAVGHVVVLSKDAEHYLHVHPLDENATGPEAKFMTTFPENGVYKIWGQFQHDNKVITVPYVVEVN